MVHLSLKEMAPQSTSRVRLNWWLVLTLDLALELRDLTILLVRILVTINLILAAMMTLWTKVWMMRRKNLIIWNKSSELWLGRRHRLKSKEKEWWLSLKSSIRRRNSIPCCSQILFNQARIWMDLWSKRVLLLLSGLTTWRQTGKSRERKSWRSLSSFPRKRTSICSSSCLRLHKICISPNLQLVSSKPKLPPVLMRCVSAKHKLKSWLWQTRRISALMTKRRITWIRRRVKLKSPQSTHRTCRISWIRQVL